MEAVLTNPEGGKQHIFRNQLSPHDFMHLVLSVQKYQYKNAETEKLSSRLKRKEGKKSDAQLNLEVKAYKVALNICCVVFSKGKTTGLLLEELGRRDVHVHSVCKENSWFQTF